MAPYSNKSVNWRELNQDSIAKWKKQFDTLDGRRVQECWDTEKMDMEIGAHLFEKDLQDIWFFAASYISRYRTGSYRKFLSGIIDEIKNYGTIEPSRKKSILKSIKTTQRRMHGK